MLVRLVYELLTSGDPLALASQNPGITSVSHCARPQFDQFSGTMKEVKFAPGTPQQQTRTRCLQFDGKHSSYPWGLKSQCSLTGLRTTCLPQRIWETRKAGLRVAPRSKRPGASTGKTKSEAEEEGVPQPMKPFRQLRVMEGVGEVAAAGKSDESCGASAGEWAGGASSLPQASRGMRSLGTAAAAAAEDAQALRREAVSGAGPWGIPPFAPSGGVARLRGFAVVLPSAPERSLRLSCPRPRPCAPAAPLSPESPEAPRLGPAHSPRPHPRRPAPPFEAARAEAASESRVGRGAVLRSRGRGQLDAGQSSKQRGGNRQPEQPRSRSSSRSRRPSRSAAEPAMALSMPLNGLKEEDKEPLIELFVKVSARLPVPPGRAPGALRAARSGVPERSRGAPARRQHPSRCGLPRPRPIVLGPPSPSRLRGPVEGTGVGTRAAATVSSRAGSGGRQTSVPCLGGSGGARGRDEPAPGPQRRARTGPVTTPARGPAPAPPVRSPVLRSAAR
ncbi:hypothetical protein AAY473_027102 [Plecturocebus cupreus]